MRFHYTDHIQMRMYERGITQWQIEQTVTYPENAVAGYQDRYLAKRHFYDRILTVIYALRGNAVILITVYWKKKAR